MVHYQHMYDVHQIAIGKRRVFIAAKTADRALALAKMGHDRVLELPDGSIEYLPTKCPERVAFHWKDPPLA
jgi:hypothetical protein